MGTFTLGVLGTPTLGLPWKGRVVNASTIKIGSEPLAAATPMLVPRNGARLRPTLRVGLAGLGLTLTFRSAGRVCLPAGFLAMRSPLPVVPRDFA